MNLSSRPVNGLLVLLVAFAIVYIGVTATTDPSSADTEWDRYWEHRVEDEKARIMALFPDPGAQKLRSTKGEQHKRLAEAVKEHQLRQETGAPRTLHRFQDARTAPPDNAITVLHNLFVEEHARASGLPSNESHGLIRCPACRDLVYIEHGDRVLCSCGLVLELYGNALTVWHSPLLNQQEADFQARAPALYQRRLAQVEARLNETRHVRAREATVPTENSAAQRPAEMEN